MNERFQISIKLISTHLILLPILIIASLFINRDSFFLMTVSQSILVILFLSGYWEFFGLRFRMIYCISIEFLLIIELLWKLSSPLTGTFSLYLTAILSIVQIYLVIEIIRIIVVIFKRDKGSFDIIFPFKHGKYLISDGGNSKMSRLMNYHFHSKIHKNNRTNYSMLFATDIVKTYSQGSRFLPKQNEDYPIFGENVYCPMGGIVVKIVNDIDDNIPYSGNYPYNTGNTIVIKNDNRFLLLGHLKKDSIKVKAGDKVNDNDWIAKAGNSGYSERPHIHIQLIDSKTDNYWKGLGLSIQFKEKNLYKNRVILV
jgi:hypothetical protein